MCLSCSRDAARAEAMQNCYLAGHRPPEFPAAADRYNQRNQQMRGQHQLPQRHDTAQVLQHSPLAQQASATLQQSPLRAAQHVRPAMNTSQRISTSAAAPRPFMRGFLLPAAEQESQVGTAPVTPSPAPAPSQAPAPERFNPAAPRRSVAPTLQPRPLAQPVSAPATAPAKCSEFERMLQLEMRKASDALPQRTVRQSDLQMAAVIELSILCQESMRL